MSDNLGVDREERPPLTAEERKWLRQAYQSLKRLTLPLLASYIVSKKKVAECSVLLEDCSERAVAILVALGYGRQAARDEVKSWQSECPTPPEGVSK